ncbi:hypothetical protein KIL84_022201 [Mauremys mutica]|uniref:BTB domain-containing protein n=1 Tax=Mauremys mutica TaxID=74926 RepID=A0A9D3X9X3_9SAUR|nr:hypothetical protein KIL84_022201 [Mauremys mutica]
MCFTTRKSGQDNLELPSSKAALAEGIANSSEFPYTINSLLLVIQLQAAETEIKDLPSEFELEKFDYLTTIRRRSGTACSFSSFWIRVLLAAVSPYFKDIFTSSCKESQGGEVVLQDMAPSILQSILKYIYTEELSLSLETAPDLFAAASKLQILPLVEICCRFLLKTISIQNCIGLYRLAQAYNHQALLYATTQLITLNFGRFCEDDDFLSLDVSSLITILSSDGLAVASELEVYQAVRRWIQFQPTTGRSLLNELMRCVRLPLLTDRELVEVQLDSERYGDVQLHWKQLDSEERLLESRGFRQGMSDELIVCVDSQMWEDQELENEDFLMGSYDPHAEKWEKLPGLKSLTHPACVALGDKLYVSGGICRNSYSDAFMNEAVIVPKLPKGIANAAVVRWEKRIYVLGGENLTQCYKTIYYWEPGEPKWSKCPEDIPVSHEGVSGFGCTMLKRPKKEILSLFQTTSAALIGVVGK